VWPLYENVCSNTFAIIFYGLKNLWIFSVNAFINIFLAELCPIMSLLLLVLASLNLGPWNCQPNTLTQLYDEVERWRVKVSSLFTTVSTLCRITTQCLQLWGHPTSDTNIAMSEGSPNWGLNPWPCDCQPNTLAVMPRDLNRLTRSLNVGLR
jgi:hypothetical protein